MKIMFFFLKKGKHYERKNEKEIKVEVKVDSRLLPLLERFLTVKWVRK
jgi:hypothetical protein